MISIKLGDTGVGFFKLGSLPKCSRALGDIVLDSAQQIELPQNDDPGTHGHGQQSHRHKAGDPVTFMPKA